MTQIAAEALSTREAAAYPFLECAVLLDNVRKGTPVVQLADALDVNAARWQSVANRAISRRGDLPSTTTEFFNRASRFMVEAARTLRREQDDSLLDMMIHMNLNMSETILTAR
ncbi:hypothetical protein [Zavarzinia compransoris]|uniref:Uncharacterized protein n=1 Tax=Zavarzinia compransoris TaxID=1264899 RepID=A0A317DYA1_9PROT|nr:hypothetical protein [Zavarzinia compransoris]PWR19708.1 hypothetical protein DKG75_14670 [Zavarzinia compransoris]TDP43346.1 hypothetical protein DES42_11247 [Zavarzinia compransoris]